MTTTPTSFALECHNLSKCYDGTFAVREFSLQLRPGTFLALLGPSGCGKTTCLRILAGFETPDTGRVVVGGREVLDVRAGVNLPPDKRRVGMVFQEYALFPHMDVASNVAYGLPRGADRARRVDEALALVGLVGVHRRMPHELSSGQQQRVALARALAPRPDVLLLDEPFSNLDASLRVQVRADVREILRAAGMTTVFVTHDQGEALSLADEVAVMMEGRLLQVAPPETLYWRPVTREVATFVGDANLLPAQAYGARAMCMLGEVALETPAHGLVEVMLRPEDIELVADPQGNAVICWREYFGHDQMIGVQLDSGVQLQVRLGPAWPFHVGQRVRARAASAKQVFAPQDGMT